MNRKSSITIIPLQRPASLRKLLPKTADKISLLPNYHVGPENASIEFLFREATLERLHELSPVVLYGEQDVGKSNLAITLASRWSRLHSARPICLTTGEQFSSQFTSALEIDDVDTFRRKHRGCKLLLIDELESLASAKATQTELAATLDALAESMKPVIITSKQLPASISGLKPRLVSRLSGGTSLAVSRPSMETAISMASALRKEIAPNVSDDDIRSLIASFPEAELTAAFVRVVVTSAAASVSSNGELDLKRAAVLAKSNVQAPAVGIKDIAKLVSRRMNIRLTDLRSSTRQARVVRARGVVTLLVRDTTNLSLQEIGEYLGGRDHSTVLHSYNKTVKLLSTDPEISALHTQLLSELSS